MWAAWQELQNSASATAAEKRAAEIAYKQALAMIPSSVERGRVIDDLILEKKKQTVLEAFDACKLGGKTSTACLFDSKVKTALAAIPNAEDRTGLVTAIQTGEQKQKAIELALQVQGARSISQAEALWKQYNDLLQQLPTDADRDSVTQVLADQAKIQNALKLYLAVQRASNQADDQISRQEAAKIYGAYLNTLKGLTVGQGETIAGRLAKEHALDLFHTYQEKLAAVSGDAGDSARVKAANDAKLAYEAAVKKLDVGLRDEVISSIKREQDNQKLNDLAFRLGEDAKKDSEFIAIYNTLAAEDKQRIDGVISSIVNQVQDQKIADQLFAQKLAQYNLSHGTSLSQEEFRKTQEEALAAVANQLKSFGGYEAVEAKWRRGEILPTDIKQQFDDAGDIGKHGLGAIGFGMRMWVNEVTQGGLVRAAVGDDAFYNTRGDLLYQTQSSAQRDFNLQAFSDSNMYRDLLKSNPLLTPEAGMKLQLAKFAKSENAAADIGVFREETKATYIQKVMRGEYDPEAVTRGYGQGLAGAGTWLLLRGNDLVDFVTLGNYKKNALKTVIGDQQEFASETLLSDFETLNPNEAARVKAEVKAKAAAEGKTERDYLRDQGAAAFSLIDKAKRGDLAAQNTTALLESDPGWLVNGALLGKINVADLNNELDQIAVNNTYYLNGTQITNDVGVKQQYDLLVQTYKTTLSPEIAAGITGTSLYQEWRTSRKSGEDTSADAYLTDQLSAWVTGQDQFAKMNMAGSLTLAEVVSGKKDAVKAKAALDEFSDPSKHFAEATAIALNSAMNGTLLQGQILTDKGAEKIRQGDNSGYWDIARGSFMKTAKPVAVTVLFAIPGVQLGAAAWGGVTLTSAMVISAAGTGLSSYFFADTAGQTAEFCSFEKNMDGYACLRSGGMLVFTGLSAGTSFFSTRDLILQGAGKATAQSAALTAVGKTGAVVKTATTEEALLAAAQPAVGKVAKGASATIALQEYQLLNRSVSGLGTVVFTANAVDTCAKEGMNANCALSAGMALVSFTRFTSSFAPRTQMVKIAGINEGVTKADRVVNIGQAVTACAALVQGQGTSDQCFTALAGAGLSFSGPGVGQKDVEGNPQKQLTDAARDIVVIKDAADGAEVTIGGKKVTVTPGARVQLLDEARVRYQASILALGTQQAYAEAAANSKEGAKAETFAQREFLENQKGYRTAADDLALFNKNPQEYLKSKNIDAIELARTRVRLEDAVQARTATVLASQELVRQEAQLLSSGSLTAGETLADRWNRLRTGKSPAEVINLQDAQKAFAEIAKQELPTGVRYQTALANLDVARQALSERGYTLTQRAVNDQIKPKVAEQKQVVTEYEALQKEIAGLEQQLRNAQDYGEGNPVLITTELANKQVSLEPLSQKYDALATEIKTLEARLQAAGTMKGRLAEAVGGTDGTGIVSAITTPISSGLFRAGKALDVAVQNLRSASRGQTVERVLVDEVSGKNLNWFEQRRLRGELNAIDNVNSDPAVTFVSDDAKALVTRQETNARQSESLRELTRTILRDEFEGLPANTAKAKAYAQELWMRIHPEDPAVAVRVAGGLVGAIGMDLDVVIRRQIADGVRGIIDQINADGRFASADGRVEGVRRRIGTMVDSLFEGDAFHPSVRDALQPSIEAALTERFPGIGAQELQGHAASVYRELAARYAVDPGIRATFVRDFASGIVPSGERAGFLDQGRSGGTWRPTIGDPGVYAKFEVATASEISGAGEM